jgi:hypothetical protein
VRLYVHGCVASWPVFNVQPLPVFLASSWTLPRSIFVDPLGSGLEVSNARSLHSFFLGKACR